jgi:hypothetical protein
MMGTTTAAPLTLGNVLFAGARTFSEQLGAGLDVGAESQEIKAALVKAAPGLPMGALVEGVAQAVQEMLDVPLTDVILGAWNRSRDLHAALQTTRESDNATVLVPLLGHTITSEHRPYVEVMQDEVPIARLVFPVKIECRLEGVALRVQHGRIGEILTGTVKIKGTLKFGDFVIFDKALAPIAIPGTLSRESVEAA